MKLRIQLDRSRLLGFDQVDGKVRTKGEGSQASVRSIGQRVGAKIGAKPGIKPNISRGRGR